MACNPCETSFQSSQSIVVSIQQSGPNRYVYITNQGRNVVMLQRILLCYRTSSGGGGMLVLRPAPQTISWIYPTAFLDPGTMALYYSFAPAGVTLTQAQAEYIEIDGRSLSCPN